MKIEYKKIFKNFRISFFKVIFLSSSAIISNVFVQGLKRVSKTCLCHVKHCLRKSASILSTASNSLSF